MTSILLSSLKTKRAEISGEMDKLYCQIADLRADLAAVDRVLMLAGYEDDPNEIAPIQRRGMPLGRTYGREIMDILHDAGEPMGTGAIAALIAKSRHLVFATLRDRRKFEDRIRTAAKRLRQKGWLETVGAGAETKWRIVDVE